MGVVKIILLTFTVLGVGICIMMIVPYTLSLTALTHATKLTLTIIWLIFLISIILAFLFRDNS